MKELSFEKMQKIFGGDWECTAAVVGLGASALGAGLSMATLQPWGVALGVIGIYSGLPAMLYSCDLM